MQARGMHWGGVKPHRPSMRKVPPSLVLNLAQVVHVRSHIHHLAPPPHVCPLNTSFSLWANPVF